MDHLYAKAYVRAAQARDRREIAERWPRDRRDMAEEIAQRWPREDRETAEIDSAAVDGASSQRRGVKTGAPRAGRASDGEAGGAGARTRREFTPFFLGTHGRGAGECRERGGGAEAKRSCKEKRARGIAWVRGGRRWADLG